MDVHETAASELLRAMRGRRSQQALARRLGYRGNPVTDWEHGRHFPTARDALRIAEACRLPVREAFTEFHALAPPECTSEGWQLAPWLKALQGGITQQELAARCACSRFAVRRWLNGEAQPKLPEFLRLLDAMTGRCFDWVALLVPIEGVPSLLPRHQQAQAAKRLAFEHPWTEALLRLLETDRHVRGELNAQGLADALGLPLQELQQLLDQLEAAGVIAPASGYYHVVGTLSVDTRSAPEGLRKLQAHWERATVARLEDGRASSADWYAYNQISISSKDLDAVQERLKQAYADIRAIVTNSEPTQEAALVVMHLAHWTPTE